MRISYGSSDLCASDLGPEAPCRGGMNAIAPVKNPFDGANDFVYNKDDFHALSELVYAEAGIVMPEGKAMLIYSRLTKYLRERAVTTFADYIAILNSDPDERRRAIGGLTTNHTKFFR